MANLNMRGVVIGHGMSYVVSMPESELSNAELSAQADCAKLGYETGLHNGALKGMIYGILLGATVTGLIAIFILNKYMKDSKQK